MFDSHPDVVYRHEPDTVLRDWSIPGICAPDQTLRHIPAARRYVRQLIEHRSLKSSGSLPAFAKSFQHPLAHRSRSVLLWALRMADHIPIARPATRSLVVPDLIRSQTRRELRVVVKSVSSCGRARLLAEAAPGCRIIFILRDPFGQVASMLRGIALGKMAAGPPLAEVLATDQASRYGLTPDRLVRMSLAERLAWHWAVLNETAIESLRDLPGSRIVQYRDLVTDPIASARSLFDFARLPWHPSTEAFITASTSCTRRARYFQVFRDTHSVSGQHGLSARDHAVIQGVLQQTTLRALWPELDSYTPQFAGVLEDEGNSRY